MLTCCLKVASILVIFVADTLGYRLEKAGFLAAAPYLVMGVLLSVSGYFADWCQIKGYLTTTQVRRYFNCGGKKTSIEKLSVPL